MTIKELIFKQPIKEICKEYCKICDISIELQEKVTQNIKLLLQEMSQINETESDHMLFVTESLSPSAENHDEFYYNANIYKLSELENSLMDLNQKILSAKEYNNILNKYSLPQSYCFLFVEREEALGYHVNLANVEYIGASTYVAVFLAEITEYGFEKDDHIKILNELEKHTKATRKMLELPQKEKDKYFITSQEQYEEMLKLPEHEQEKCLISHYIVHESMHKENDNFMKMIEWLLEIDRYDA